MRDIEADALNASMNSIVEACIFLMENGNILLGKREGGERLPFDLQKQSDEGYLSNFFGRGSFELKVTHQGRKRLEENEENRSGTEPQREKVPTQKSAEAQKSDEASNKKASAPKEEIPQTAEDVSTLEFRLRELSENALFYFDSATGTYRESGNTPLFSQGSAEASAVRSKFEVRGNELANRLRGLGFEIIEAASHSPLMPKADVDDLRITIRKMVSALRFREYTHYSSYVVHEEDRVYGIQPESSQERDVSPEQAQTLFSEGMRRLREVVNDFIDLRASGRAQVSEPKGAGQKMARTAIVLNVLIASPSDVGQERNVVTEVIHAWNAVHYRTTGIMLHPVRWETHSYPASGDRPQAILNKQIVESGDILIGIFGYKLGTPTGKAQSGTIEEIEEFREAGKYVALYFSKADVPRSADRDQLKALEDYQRERQKDTLYGTFGTAEELRLLVTQHLPRIVADVSASQQGPASGTGLPQAHSGNGARVAFSHTNDDLSPKEIELLWNAAKDPSDILHNITLDGESIRVNGRQFLAGVDARAGAEWVAAFQKLEERGYIEPLSHDSDFFRVTGDGYQAADTLEEFARWDAKSVVLRAHYFRGPSDEITLSCTSVIAIPARYFDDQIGTDGTIQRSVKEPPSLIVEGISSKPALAWTPTEIEFLDPASKKLQSFRVEGMAFLRPRSLKLPLATESVRPISLSADDGRHGLVQADLLPATEELIAAAEPESESRPDGFLVGSRNAWVRFLEQCWPIIGPQILSIAQKPASTIEEVRLAFLPAKEHPHDSGLGTDFYRERIQQATPADVVATGMRFDEVAAEILQAAADKDRAANSCADAQAALELATNPKDKELVEQVVQQRKGNLTQLDAKLAELQRTQKELEETLRDQQAYVCRFEMLDFLRAAEHPVDPRHIANAVAALPRKNWRESFALCSPIPFDAYVQHEYQVFLVISAILNDHASDLNDGPVEVFRRALLKLPLRSPGQPFFWENWGDLKSVIEELGNSGPLDSFRLTDMFLKKAMRQKNSLEKLQAESERLRG